MPTSRVKKLVISARTYRLVLVSGASGSSTADRPRFSNIEFFSEKAVKRFSKKIKKLNKCISTYILNIAFK